MTRSSPEAVDSAAASPPAATSAMIHEILVSSTVRDLTTGGDVAFEDRGEHELKGIDGPRRLFAVADR
jgi:class 3 adenylate cyclase